MSDKTGTERCEAVLLFLGIGIGLCGDPAAGQFSGACVHEHVKVRWLCEHHAATPEAATCRGCWDLPGADSHECPIALAPVPEGANR